jgi:uncharacterized protein (DUF362 family)/Pyruvate/2-oxoacid:ferredoxin oxidoreductase delta subunit
MSDPAKVTVIPCDSYVSGFPECIESLLEPIGGLSSFVSQGSNVLIKPNLLTDRHPDEAITTHPEVVRHLVRMVRDCGGTPSVGDSPASTVKLSRVQEKTGFLDMCREEEVPLLNMEQSGSVEIKRDGYTFHIAKPVLDADVVISAPKVKTHVLTVLTAGVKNMYGTIPGFLKANLHKEHPAVPDFGRLVAAICRTVPPALSVADAVVGLQGDGPGTGGRPARLNFLAASADAFSLDLAICKVLGINPKAVSYLNGTGVPSGLPDIQVIGASSIDDLSPADFDVPSTLGARLVPAFLVNLLERFLWIRPAVMDACISCGRCVASCPVTALSMAPKEKPRLEPEKCIGCCCCHEICPEKAIKMAQSPLLNLIRRGRQP